MDFVSQLPNLFGDYRHSLDEKNRLTIPSRWRRAEGEEWVIVPEPQNQFLMVMFPEEFARVTSQVEANPNLVPKQRRAFLRQFHALAQHGVADKQGRLVISDEHRRLVGLKGEVALVGGRGRFEIWNAANWKRSQEEESATYQHVAQMIGL
jgi:MraZ protein